MTDQERLIHIAGKLDKMLSMVDTEGNGEVNILAIKNDIYWLIGKIKKAEEGICDWKEIVKIHNTNGKILNEKVERYELALQFYSENLNGQIAKEALKGDI